MVALVLAFYSWADELTLLKFNHLTPKHLEMEQSMAVTL